MEWVTQTTTKTWRLRPAKQFLMVNDDLGPIWFTKQTRTMDFPLQWQGSPCNVVK